MLREILASTKLSPAFCAELVGVAPDQFHEWLTGQRPLPRFAVAELSSILGVDEKTLRANVSKGRSASGELAPAIWYKLRDEKLQDDDREMVGVVRKLGYYIDQLRALRSVRVRQFEIVFSAVRNEVDRTDPPAVQGAVAAQAFRDATGLQHGQRGVGDLIRGVLRSLGVLVVETPIKSAVEGCTFKVGADSAPTPCLFANSFRSTWFRRNEVILHELAHAILDLENEQLALDFRDTDSQSEFVELRAQVFAQECLVPGTALMSGASRHGLVWSDLSADGIAKLIADLHAEQRLVLRAAFDNELIDQEQFDRYSVLDCDALVRSFSTHALSTREYLKSLAVESPKWSAENRSSNRARPIRLPSAYVKDVLIAYNDCEISLGKAAEMLMMEEETFQQRFCTTGLGA